MTGRAAPAPGSNKVAKRGLRHRVADELIAFATIGGLKLVLHMPEKPLWRMADFAGGISYRASKVRRDRARRNLRRVVEWMAANNEGAESYRRAASDPKALEEIVRSAFRNHARYYVEMARAPKCNSKWIDERMTVETPVEADALMAGRRAVILVGMHFGAIEMPGFYAVRHLGEIVAPMETVANARIQRYIFSTRATIGTRIVTIEAAGPELIGALRRNEPVGLVADRDITGAGIEVEMFGAKTRIPAGPPILAVETGAPIYVATVRRAASGRYLGKVWPLATPEGSSRRERSRALAREEARAFEHMIIDAPEQWLALFHPIWPDLEQPTMQDGSGE
jgi:phosphatidylinositol dimannoside acyltransferase